MKKIIVAMAAIAAALTMASCNKEQPVSPNENPTVGKSVITATIENDLTKAYLDANGNDTDGYKVFWSAGDKLFVGSQDEIWYAEYTLDEASAGSSNGTFCWKEGAIFHSKTYSMPEFEVDWRYSAYYPFSINVFDDEGNFIGGAWKTEQTYADMYIPMFAAAECTEEGKADFVFTNLGGLLRLTVKGTATIRSIELRAAETMSGAIDCMSYEGDGYIMLIKDDTHGGIHYVTLDCGKDGVELNDEEGTDFYFSLPCCFDTKNWEIDGYSDVTITLTDTDGKTCVKKLNNKKLVIERSKITTATFTASEFNANVPEGALPGKFSVSADKQVYFSQGNLYYDGSAFKFEDSQTGFASEWNPNYVSHFFWSKTASVAYAELYSDSGTDEYDVFFTNVTDETANPDFTVNGVTGQYRTLSDDEWKYLFDNNSFKWVTINGVGGYAIAPDHVTLPEEKTSYTETELNDAKLVFLPAAGLRLDSDIDPIPIGNFGIYWSSYANGPTTARFVSFEEDGFGIVGDERLGGLSVRLVTDVK